jgi:hypothetical protein
VEKVGTDGLGRGWGRKKVCESTALGEVAVESCRNGAGEGNGTRAQARRDARAGGWAGRSMSVSAFLSSCHFPARCWRRLLQDEAEMRMMCFEVNQ